MEADKKKGGRPPTLKFSVSPGDYKELEKMGLPTASPPDQMAAMLLHVALENYCIEVRKRGNGKS
jgi:hypothetical protein